MGNLGPGELLVILAIALLVFGPKKLPEIGKGIGNALREFNKAKNDFMETINSEVHRDDYSNSSASHTSETPGETAEYTGGGADHHPKPVETAHAEALPYGSDFYAVEGESQPSFRTAQPVNEPAFSAAHSNNAHRSPAEPAAAGSGEGKA